MYVEALYTIFTIHVKLPKNYKFQKMNYLFQENKSSKSSNRKYKMYAPIDQENSYPSKQSLQRNIIT